MFLYLKGAIFFDTGLKSRRLEEYMKSNES